MSSERRRTVALLTPAAAIALAATVISGAPAAAETLSDEQLAGIVSDAGLPCVTGTAVALAESGGNTDATGSAGERGLFQVHPVHNQPNMYDPHANASYAAELHAEQGWGPWAAHSNGSYTRYLDDARAACGSPASAPEPEPQPEPEPESAAPSKGAATEPEPSSAGGATYEVQRGDTLSELAAERDTSAGHLFDMNADRIDDPDLIYVGQTLDVTGHPRT